VLEEPNARIENVYFPEHGVASVVATMPDGKTIETGLIGREGMSGTTVVLGNHAAFNKTYMQVAGHGSCLAADDLRQQLTESPTLRLALLRYVEAFLIQTSQTAAANGQFKLEERLARWLLMVHDRVGGSRLELTHEFLSTMLGVRRPGVTTALHELEGKGLIRSQRSLVIVVDRAGLEELADGCYGEPEKQYQRIMSDA
jgi:CRP-like cAMP-binding protein